MSTYPLLSRIVAAAVNVSIKSGRILRDVKKSGELNVQEKGVNDYVTKADFLSQLNIIKSLEKQFPNLKFCGEEGNLTDEYTDLETSLNEEVLKQAKIVPSAYESLKEEDLLVWVDPLDGTKEYTMGYEVANEVTVLIGVAWNGKPIAGVVTQPFFEYDKQKQTDSYIGRVLWGIVGLGAYDLSSGKLNPVKKNSEVKTIVTTRSHLTPLIKRDLTNIPNTNLIHTGGAGYKVLHVIDGKADYYVYPKNGTKRWDTCAPEALIKCLDGTAIDIFGNEYSYVRNEQTLEENCYGVIFSLEKDLSGILNHISDELKEQVNKEADLLKEKKLKK